MLNTPEMQSVSQGHVEVRCCEVCGSVKKHILFHQSFTGVSEGSLLTGYDVVICEDCGFGYADGIPAQYCFDAYYECMSKYEYGDRDGKQIDFDTVRFPAAVEFIRAFVPDSGVRVLDVGCSNGGLLHALRQVGFTEVTGLDPSPACACTAERLYGISVITGTLFDQSSDIARYDLVLLAAVLEHVRDLRVSLERVRDMLVPGGLLFVEVPDAVHFSAVTDAPLQEFSVEHINYFSIVSLRNLLQSNGFTEVESKPSSMIQGKSTEVHVINAMFRVTSVTPCRPLTRDRETETNLLAYIRASLDVEQRIHVTLEPWVRSQRPIIVWGVGTHTQRLMATGPLARANIAAFVDSNPRYQGKQINGVPILSPTALKDRPEPILISSRFFQTEIKQQIRDELGLKNELIMLYDV